MRGHHGFLMSLETRGDVAMRMQDCLYSFMVLTVGLWARKCGSKPAYEDLTCLNVRRDKWHVGTPSTVHAFAFKICAFLVSEVSHRGIRREWSIMMQCQTAVGYFGPH